MKNSEALQISGNKVSALTRGKRIPRFAKQNDARQVPTDRLIEIGGAHAESLARRLMHQHEPDVN